MSFYRDSPGKRSAYNRSPPRLLSTERELIEEEIHLKNGFRAESQNRRLLDEIALLQIKLRKTDELEIKMESLIKQNTLLAQQNQHLSRQLAQRRYQIQRYRSSTAQLQERDSIKTAQLAQINRSLQIEIDLLKKERLQSNKLYESHIQKLQIMLEDKLKQVDILGLRCNDLLNQKQMSQIRFQEERNKLKNTMVRTTHDKERQLEYNKQKSSTQKFVEIQTLKKNYTSQIVLLEDQINKLKAANSYKVAQFESQLVENKNIRSKYEQEVKILENENNGLRQRILKLEEINRSEVVNIEVKYNDIQKKGANSLIHGHEQQIGILISQIDRHAWLLKDKNQEIQILIKQKKEHKFLEEERQLSMRAQIDTLKNKLVLQQDKTALQNQELSQRINKLTDKLLRESQNYHQRVNQFKERINSLEGQLKFKQGELDNARAQHDLTARESQRNADQVKIALEKTRRSLADSQASRSKQNSQSRRYKEVSQLQTLRLSKKVNQLDTLLQESIEKQRRGSQTSGDSERLLKLQIGSLSKNIAFLELKLSEERNNHSKQMGQLSSSIKQKIERLQAAQKKTIDQIELSRSNQTEALARRNQKLARDKAQMQKKLSQYVRMYQDLQKYFASPHEGPVFTQKSESNVYQALQKSLKSTIHIF